MKRRKLSINRIYKTCIPWCYYIVEFSNIHHIVLRKMPFASELVFRTSIGDGYNSVVEKLLDLEIEV